MRKSTTQFRKSDFLSAVFAGVLLLALFFLPLRSLAAGMGAPCTREETNFFVRMGCLVNLGVQAIGDIAGGVPSARDQKPAPDALRAPEGAARIEERALGFSRNLSALAASYEKINAEGRTMPIEPLVSLAREREASMIALMEKNPALFLAQAMSREEASRLPNQVQQHVERDVTLTGKVETIHYDDFKNRTSREEYFLRTGGERVRLYPVGLQTPLVSGTTLRLQGKELGSNVAALASPATFEVTGTPSLNAAEPQKTLFVLVNFLDSGTPPFTVEEAKKKIFDGQFQKFYEEQSYGKTYWTGDVVGWYTYPTNSTCDGYSGWPWPDDPRFPDIVKRYQLNLSKYDHVAFLVQGGAQNNVCGGGFSSVGKYTHFVNGVQYTFSASDIGLAKPDDPSWWGAQPFPWTNLDDLLSHELGHALGVLHANAWVCNDGHVLYGRDCTHQEYGNHFDVMGTGGYALQMNALYKEELGWLDNSSLATITKSGTYTLKPLENSSGIRGLKIKTPLPGAPSSAGTAPFYLEYRRGIGFDANLNDPYYVSNQQGVLVNRYVGGFPFPFPRLLDMTPNGATPDSWTLNVNAAPFADPGLGITLGPVVKADASGTTLDIKIQSPVCVRHYPSLNPSSYVLASTGSETSYWFSIQNNDSAPCGASRFKVPLSDMGDWAYKLYIDDTGSAYQEGYSFVMNPGEERGGYFLISIPANAASGSYIHGALQAVNTDSNLSTIKKDLSFSITQSLGASLFPGTPPERDVTQNQSDVSFLKFNITNGSNSNQISQLSFSDGNLVAEPGTLALFDGDGKKIADATSFYPGYYDVFFSPPLSFSQGETKVFDLKGTVSSSTVVTSYMALNGADTIMRGTPLTGPLLHVIPKASLLITSPTEGASYEVGGTLPIRWTSQSIPEKATVDIYLIDPDRWKIVKDIAMGYPASRGAYDFQIPDDILLSMANSYEIIVKAITKDPTTFDISKRFGIALPVVPVPSNLGGSVKYPREVTLTWKADRGAQGGFEVWGTRDLKEPPALLGRIPAATYAAYNKYTTMLNESDTDFFYKVRAFKTRLQCPINIQALGIKLWCATVPKYYSEFSPFLRIRAIPPQPSAPAAPGGTISIPRANLKEINLSPAGVGGAPLIPKAMTGDAVIFSVPQNLTSDYTIEARFEREGVLSTEAWKASPGALR